MLPTIANAILPATFAAFYGGGGVQEGVEEAGRVTGDSDLRSVIQATLDHGIAIMGAVAVLAIVIAGVMLVVQGGDESTRQRAIRAVIYVVAGLILILIASAIVTFVAEHI